MYSMVCMRIEDIAFGCLYGQNKVDGMGEDFGNQKCIAQVQMLQFCLTRTTQTPTSLTTWILFLIAQDVSFGFNC